jgi:hypothetical protein
MYLCTDKNRKKWAAFPLFMQDLIKIRFRNENSNAEANPTIVNYNANAVKIYNATSSLVRFEIK